MKRITSFLLIGIFLFAGIIWAEPGDTPPDNFNKMWQIAASGGVTLLTTAMNGMPSGFQAASSKNIFVPWMQVAFGQPGSLNLAINDDVLYLIVNRIVGYEHDNARLDTQYIAPQNPVVTGTTITCDEDATRDVKLYSWNFVVFTEVDKAPSIDGGTVTFSGVASGTYVLGFDGGFNSMPTVFLTVE